jgi:hypothetical protein
MARADHDDRFIEIICNPVGNSLFLRSLHISDSPLWGGGDVEKNLTSSLKSVGIYTIDNFVKSGESCRLQGKDISIKAIEYIQPSMGKCAENNIKLQISVGSRNYDTFWAFGEDCNTETHQIVASSDNKEGKEISFILDDCKIPEILDEDPSCKDIKIE